MKYLGICLAIAIIVLAAMWIFNIPGDTLLYAGILLACPLMHVFMMRGGKHKH